MVKSELIRKLQDEHPHLSTREVEQVLNAFFSEIAETLVRQGRVELRGFGSLYTSQRNGRSGRNPRSGEPVVVSSKRVPWFRTSKLLTDRMNG